MKQYISQILSQSLTELASEEAPGILGETVFDISYPRPDFGDYASNAAMVVFKQFNSAPAPNPPALAKQLAELSKKYDKDKTFSKIEAVGGFINFTLAPEYLAMRVADVVKHTQNYGRSEVGSGRTVIVEYFQNNIAKPSHVGHLRSAVLGDSMVRILRFLGYKAISDTHVGDWGTQFGILLYAYKTMGDQTIVEKDPISELYKLYVEMSAKIENQPELRDLGKAEFKKLEDGDPENRELWQWFVKVSMEDFERYRRLLGLLPFDYNLGESFYEDKMPAILKEFSDKGLITTGETGELYVDLEAQGLGRCILVKSDGATTYHLRDFATYFYRKQEFDFYRNLYAVDIRQAHHFRQLFRVLEMAGYPAETDSCLIEFGLMTLPETGAASTRKGQIISLNKLMSEAEQRAADIIEQKNPDLKNKAVIAKQVALAAIKYFDLSHNRKTDVEFTWDKALSFDGNTGPYLQYTHARIYGILRKAGHNEPLELVAPLDPVPLELVVMRKLHKFPEVVEQVTEEYLPNVLCNYLFELAQSFNSFYHAVPVMQETDPAKRQFRLSLITATAHALKNGLGLLGIEAPEEM
jgi:arginyl-tRNA synthetase